MKIAVIGARGQFGQDLVLACYNAHVECVPLNRPEIDVKDYWSIQNAFRLLSQGDVVINTANDLWAAEAQHLDGEDVRRSIAYPVNAIADLCVRHSIRLVQISTDYVFGNGGPHAPNSKTGAVCKYGDAKVVAEGYAQVGNRHPMVVRVGCLFGPHKTNGGRINFVERMAIAATHGDVDVVDDVITSPTYTLPAAKAIVGALLDGSSHRIFHACARNSASYYDVARFIYHALRSKFKVNPKKCDEKWRPRDTSMKPSYRSAIWEDDVIEYLIRFGFMASEHAFAVNMGAGST